MTLNGIIIANVNQPVENRLTINTCNSSLAHITGQAYRPTKLTNRPTAARLVRSFALYLHNTMGSNTMIFAVLKA